MNIKEAIYEIEKNKACELFFSEIIEYVQSISGGEVDVLDSDDLHYITESAKSLINSLEEKRKVCYDTVVNLQKMEIKNVSKSNNRPRKSTRPKKATK